MYTLSVQVTLNWVILSLADFYLLFFFFFYFFAFNALYSTFILKRKQIKSSDILL